jgi:hypothetical protein
MNVSELAQRTEAEVKTAADRLDAEVTGGYACDLLSAVMANAKEGNVWVTWHGHPNIVAVAVLVKLAAIVVVSGREPEEETIQKAEEEKIPILVTRLPAFEVIGKLYATGISGL